MIALQEELDWLCYSLYGIESRSDVCVSGPDDVIPASPTMLPWALEFVAAEANKEHGSSDMYRTRWFTRHGWEPLAKLPPEASPILAERVEARRRRIRANAMLGLLENANCKRRWSIPDYDAEEQAALASWLADQIERNLSERSGRPCTLAQLTTALESDARAQAVAELLAGRKDYSLAELIAEAVYADSVPNHPFHIFKPSGLEKRNAWERTWEEQRKEDAGLLASPEVPPKYTQGDFLKPECFRLRGKLDVPKERFIEFTEEPGRGGGETLYGWARWPPVERVKALLAMDEECEDQGIALADRIAILDSAWRLIPDLMRDDAATGARLKAELQALVGPDGPSKVLLDDWRKRFPPPGKGRGQGKKAKAVKPAEADDEDDE